MVSRIFGALALTLILTAVSFSQSGAHRPRQSGYQYGVNLTFAILQYDEATSPALKNVTRLKTSFSDPEAEKSFLAVDDRLADVALRHSRLVGLLPGQKYTDAILLGPEYMVIEVRAAQIDTGGIKCDVNVRYANKPLLDVKDVPIDSFETLLFKGGKGMFGAKYFVGSGGHQDSAPIERTLLVSVKPDVVPSSALKNRPGELSYPVDQNGNRVTLNSGDLFTPPVALERVVPKFETGRAITGAVTLTAVISEDGKVTNVRVLESIDSEIDQRAIEAFRQYKFSPALLNGKPAAAAFRQEISFARDLSPWEIEEAQDKEKSKNKKNPIPKTRRSPLPWPPLL